MKKRRRFLYRRGRGAAEDVGGDGQDSFLDVVSNLVAILIILVTIAGARVRDAVPANVDGAVANAADSNAADGSDSDSGSAVDSDEAAKRAEYVAAVESFEELRAKVEKSRAETEELSAQTQLVENQADGAENEYKALFGAVAELDAAIETESRRRSDADKAAFDLKSRLFEKEKARDDLKSEKDALEAIRPNATTLENVPTPLSEKVEEGREGFFCVKGGKISHVPLNVFWERVRGYFKNFRGDLSQKEHEEKIGPIEGYSFHFFVNLDSRRDENGLRYTFLFRYGECVPVDDSFGEPVDEALTNPDSEFRAKLAKYVRGDTTITLFVYPDSFSYLRDVKKFLLANGYRVAMRPLPADAPIAVSPEGTETTSY